MQHQQRGLGQVPDQGKTLIISELQLVSHCNSHGQLHQREHWDRHTHSPEIIVKPLFSSKAPVWQVKTIPRSSCKPWLFLSSRMGWPFLHGSSHHQDLSKKTNTFSDTFWESKHSCYGYLMVISGLKLRCRLLPKQPPWRSCCFFSWKAETLSISSLPLLLLILPDFLEKEAAIAWLRRRIIIYPSQKCSRAGKELGESFVPGHGYQTGKALSRAQKKTQTREEATASRARG